jgi:cytochrome c oxidase cbb3-type subunit 1
MLLATARHTYPPVNPSSGGPTGADLLGSTLGVLWIFLLAPALFGLPRRRERPTLPPLVLLLLAQLALFVVARAAGESSHHDALQLAALASLLAWVWPLPRFLYAFEWPAPARPWLAAFLLWAAALLATGLLAFLPGVLERVKFTNALVGHAHIAMAGMASSFGALVLLVLNRGTRLAGALAAPRPFAWWQAGCALHVAAVVAVGGLEARDPGVLFRPSVVVTVLYAVRALAGLLMLAAAGRWLRRALKEIS